MVGKRYDDKSGIWKKTDKDGSFIDSPIESEKQ
jgi:hypothetical protein